MASIPVPPPPPPAIGNIQGLPVAPKLHSTSKNMITKVPDNSQNKEDPKESISNLMKRLNLPEENTRCVFKYKPLEAVIQDGPMCGLVALCMASQYLDKPRLDATEVLKVAQEKHFSKQGEMFSADYMAILARDLLCCVSEVHCTNLDEQIMDALLTGNPVLIPYDKDGNNEPCCKQGQKAHWAILSGVVCLGLNSIPNSMNEEVSEESSQELPQIVNVPDRCDISYSTLKPHLSEDSHIYVFAKQGKSKHTGLWHLDSLLKSNANLVKLGPKIESDLDNFVVANGIESGLCGQIVVLKTDRLLT